MSANVETMFSVREKPWHGLGQVVDFALSSKDAIQAAGLDWNVIGKPIFDQQGNEIPGFIANTRDTDNSVLGIVSDKYKVVQNSDAFEFTDALLAENVLYETAGSLKNGRTIWLLAKMPEQNILGDKFEPYICFCNTHDGTGSIRVCMTPIRVVCNNTLNVALSTAKRSWSTKHMGDMNSKLAEAKHTLGLATDYMQQLDEEADRLANIQVSDEQLNDIFDAMFPIDYTKDSPRKINNINEMKQNLIKCYAMPDVAQFKGTAWGIVNAATDMVAHCAPARVTKSYQENNWGKIIGGHPFVDAIYSAVKTI